MARAIEFRAWDKNRKIMVGSSYPKNWEVDEDEYWGNWVLIELSSIEYLDKNKDFELMQFTGLLDKTGKKIFEGDIVRQKRKDNCFNDGEYVETVLIGQPEYWELSNQSTGGPDGDQPIIEMEILGNKFQNPELLK